MSAPLDTGRFFFVGFPGTELDRETREVLLRLRPGGIILFDRNLDDVEQLTHLIRDLREMLPQALFTVDAEGGKVDRLKKVLGPSVAGEALARHSASLAYESGRWLGHGLALFGIDLDLAPTVDLDRGEKHNALDGRYLGRTPEEVTERARAFLHGLASAGVGGCLKHFPGLGGASEDTHLDHAPVYLPRSELVTDLQPFIELGREAGAVMVSHASYPAYDHEPRPATLSGPILQGLLRDEVGFDGLAMSDDLEMKAFEKLGDAQDLAEAAFVLGCDVLLVCHHPELALEMAEGLAERAPEARQQEAAERLERYRTRLETHRLRDPQRGGLDRHTPGPDLAQVQERIAAVKAAGEREAEEVETA